MREGTRERIATVAGYYEYRRDEDRWQSFQPFNASPHVKALDASTQLIDLNSDGRAEIVTIEQDRLIWYPSKGKEGFGTPVELAKRVSNGRSMAPTIGANPALDYFFADLTGDGLPDPVRITNGRVEYWPQLGNGQFGAGVVMEDAPWLDSADGFDAARVRLVDIDGSGTADLMYIGQGEIQYWINASGNRFIPGGRLTGLPYIDNPSSAQVFDFLGDGTLCLVWSCPLNSMAHSPIQYIQLTEGQKPRLLVGVDNSMGQEFRVTYGHSASHYLRDKNAGREWLSRLPHHVTVVDRLEVIDQIGNTRAESLYEYHDGFFDSEERTFRGFCLVDQFDSESYRPSAAITEEDYTDPACVRTWFHSGTPGLDECRSQDYWTGDPQAAILTTEWIEKLEVLDAEEYLQAYRALAGSVIRTEVFGLESELRREHPFETSQNSYLVRHLQPAGEDQEACFLPMLRESLRSIYEMEPSDPRVSHAFTLVVDDFGNVRQSCSVAYPRRTAPPSLAAVQQNTFVDVTLAEYFNLDQPNRYIAGIQTEEKTYEAAEIPLPSSIIFLFDEIKASIDEALSTPLPFSEAFSGDPQVRLAAWSRKIFWNDDLTAELAWGEVGQLPLLHHSETACFDDAFIADTFDGRVDSGLLTAEGFYRFHDGYWWQASAELHYLGPESFHLPSHMINLDEGTARFTYDESYWLNLVSVTDALENSIAAEIDYHLPAPQRITDTNQNVSEVHYDPLGMTRVATSFGEVLASDGISMIPLGNAPLADYRPQDEAFVAILAEPERFLQTASSFTFYDLESWTAERQPVRSLALVRAEFLHGSDGSSFPTSPIQVVVMYQDGFGRTLQAKQRVEGGAAITRDAAGNLILDADGPLLTHADRRWLCSGGTFYNNKALVTRQYEPFFTPTPEFEPDDELQTFGHTTITSYDPLGRPIRTMFPNGTLTRSSATAWEIRQYDPNDAVNGSRYEDERESLTDNDFEKQALRKAQDHAGTPLVAHLDPWGRSVVLEEMDRAGTVRRTETVLDFSGQPLRIIDARRLDAFTYRRDMLGRALFEHSLDAGLKWSLPDAFDRPIHSWDGRESHRTVLYDRLGRVTQVWIEGDGSPRRITERMEYGDDPAETGAERRNARGQLVRHYDPAGLVIYHRYDLDGTPIWTERRLLIDPRVQADWTVVDETTLEARRFTTQARADALGRPTWQRTPDGVTRRFVYLPGGGVGRASVTTADGMMADQPFLQEAEYNARGERTRILLGNGVELAYTYDPESFRLSSVLARRPGGGAVQDIHYTYDPVGNLTHVLDRAQEAGSSMINGLAVSPLQEFTYDAFYQLVRATGRVHEALEQHDYDPGRELTTPGWMAGSRRISLNDGAHIRQYTRLYGYDLGSNLQFINHTTHIPGGSRTWIAEMWVSATSNRSLPALDLADLPIADPESLFDAAGNCLHLPHLRRFSWNADNRLENAVIIDRSAEGRPDDVEFYVYGGDGLRVRKVTQQLKAGGHLQVTEKIYLDGCELKRITLDGTPTLERWTSHLDDGSGRLGLLHQWTMDTREMETDDLGEKRLVYSLSNQVGSVSLELGESGRVISYEEYFPFGGTAFIAGDNAREVRLKEYRYSGKERDDATGLYDFGYRYYAPWMGRWLNPDPLGPQDGLNLYQYVRNNPINIFDPNGLQEDDLIDRLEAGRRRLHMCVTSACTPTEETPSPPAEPDPIQMPDEPVHGERSRHQEPPPSPEQVREQAMNLAGIIQGAVQQAFTPTAPPPADTPDPPGTSHDQEPSATEPRAVPDRPRTERHSHTQDPVARPESDQTHQATVPQESQQAEMEWPGFGGLTWDSRYGPYPLPEVESAPDQHDEFHKDNSQYRPPKYLVIRWPEQTNEGVIAITDYIPLSEDPVTAEMQRRMYPQVEEERWREATTASEVAEGTLNLLTAGMYGRYQEERPYNERVIGQIREGNFVGAARTVGEHSAERFVDDLINRIPGVAEIRGIYTGINEGVNYGRALQSDDHMIRGQAQGQGIGTIINAANAVAFGAALSGPRSRATAETDRVEAPRTSSSGVSPSRPPEPLHPSGGGAGSPGSGTFASRGLGSNAERAAATRLTPEQIDALVAELESEGVTVVRGRTGSEVLDWYNEVPGRDARALYRARHGAPGVIVIGENATAIEILEESTHFLQHQRSGFSAPQAIGRSGHFRMEYSAKHIVWNYMERSGILTNADMAILNQHIAYYRALLLGDF